MDGATGTPGLPGEPGRDGLRGTKGEKVHQDQDFVDLVDFKLNYCILKLCSYYSKKRRVLCLNIYFRVHSALSKHIFRVKTVKFSSAFLCFS